MAGPASVRIVGLRELQADLRAVDASLPRELRSANAKAAQIVADRARVLASLAGRQAAKAAESVKVLAQQRSAALRIGGPGYDFALGSEFGSSAHPQFPAWRGRGDDAGHWLYPAVRQEHDRVVDLYGDLVMAALERRAFPD